MASVSQLTSAVSSIFSTGVSSMLRSTSRRSVWLGLGRPPGGISAVVMSGAVWFSFVAVSGFFAGGVELAASSDCGEALESIMVKMGKGLLALVTAWFRAREKSGGSRGVAELRGGSWDWGTSLRRQEPVAKVRFEILRADRSCDLGCGRPASLLQKINMKEQMIQAARLTSSCAVYCLRVREAACLCRETCQCPPI